MGIGCPALDAKSKAAVEDGQQLKKLDFYQIACWTINPLYYPCNKQIIIFAEDSFDLKHA